MSLIRIAVSAFAVSLALLAGACSDGDDTSDDDDATSTTAAPELTEYDTVAAMQAALDEAGVTCELEYEGLEDEQRELSRCTIEGEQTTLTVWNDESFVAEFLAESPTEDRVAVGINWTVDAASAEVARQVADALGGVVPADVSDTSVTTAAD
jgi:hypothetical protein